MGFILNYSTQSLKNDTLLTLDSVLRESFDRSIKWEVETIHSISEAMQTLIDNDVLTEGEGQEILKHIVREARYGADGYFWADKSDGTNVVLLGGDSEGKNRINLTDKKGNKLIQDIIRNGKKPGGGYTEYWFPKAGGDEPLPKRAYSLFLPKQDWIIGTGNYIDDIDTQVNSYQEEIDNKLLRVRGFVFIMILVSFIIVATISLFVGIAMTKTIKETSQALEEISNGEGDLTKQLNIKTKDEIGILAKAFNNFNAVLRGMIRDIRESLDSTLFNSQELIAISTETSASVTEISANSNSIEKQVDKLNQKIDHSVSSINKITESISNLDHEIENQATAVEESSAAVIQMVSSINSVAKKSQDKITVVHEMIDITKQGRLEMEATRDKVDVLTESIGEILQITKMIDDISSQSGLLSMNASIEAAHAGDSGKGFAVVAGEIRKLADDAAKYANSIDNTLKANMDSIEDVKSSVDSFLHVFNGIESGATETEKVFAEISGAMTELSAGVEEINHAIVSLQDISSMVNDNAKEISHTVVEVKTSSSDLKDISNMVVAAVTEINQGLSYINDAMLGLNDSVNSISSEIKDVDNKVAIFKT